MKQVRNDADAYSFSLGYRVVSTKHDDNFIVVNHFT